MFLSYHQSETHTQPNQADTCHPIRMIANRRPPVASSPSLDAPRDYPRLVPVCMVTTVRIEPVEACRSFPVSCPSCLVGEGKASSRDIFGPDRVKLAMVDSSRLSGRVKPRMCAQAAIQAPSISVK